MNKRIVVSFAKAREGKRGAQGYFGYLLRQAAGASAA